METRIITVGILGAGRIGQVHARTLLRLPGVALRAIADPLLAERPDLLAGLVPESIELCADPRVVLADSRIEAVLICTPTPTHAELIEAAARSGKQVFCEKPIDLDPLRIGRVLETVAAAGIRLQVGFNRRFDPSFLRVRRGIEAGEVGELHVLRITSRDPAPPPPEYLRTSGGIFLDMTIHDFDLVRFLSASEVLEVHALGGVLVDAAFASAGDIDTAVVTLRLASGALAVIDNSRRAVYGYDQRVEAFGSLGALEARNQRLATTRLSTASGVRSEKPPPFFLERYEQAFAAELAAFCAALREDREPPVTGEDGLQAVLVALAARRSLETGQPVRLADRNDEYHFVR